ncbi:hypothetical protein [Pseudomonas sp. EL_65y_Pfl2_R95]
MPRYLLILLIPLLIFGISYLSNKPSSTPLASHTAVQTMPLAGIGDIFTR